MPAVPEAPKIYAVVVSQATYDRLDWRAVVDALVTKHQAEVIRYDQDVDAAAAELSAWMPDCICFVATPREASRDFVVKIHRMTRRLDSDPYTDALWGILTGYDAGDALRIARRTEPLHISRAASGVGPGALSPFKEGFASVESSISDFWIRKDGNTVDVKVSPDPAKSMAEGFNTMAPEVFWTSGHATEKDWQMGYNIRSGQLRCKDGQLFALNLKGERFDIHSPNPKVYIPMGNCLVGHIPGPDCMATAWMHTGGVHQMVAYTVVTWYGYMGWGTSAMFGNGRYDLAEAFFFNNQSLLYRLRTEFPAFADIDFETYEPGLMDAMIAKHGLVKTGKDGKPEMVQDAAGLLWDRDTVAFYGDPGWEARMPRQELPWKQSFSAGENGRIVFTLTTTAEGNWPDRPFMAWLPVRLSEIKVVEGPQLKPVITDNFLLLPLKGKFAKGEQFRLVFEGTRMKRPNADRLKKIAAIEGAVAALPEGDRPAARDAMKLAGDNRDNLIAAIEALKGEQLEALAFLIVNMPPPDLKSLSRDFLADDVRLALQARHKAPWGKDVPKQVFLNDLLPYANVDEPRDPWRKDFMKRFSARAWKCKSPGEAAVMLNREIYKELGVTYHATNRPRPNQSPAESIKAGYASCTGLSILLADVCRSCGIPARLVGIPSWKDGQGDANGNHGGNHTWVEVWSDGKWWHIGAYDGGDLSSTWFTAKAAGPAVDGRSWQHSIYAASFKKTGGAFPMVWAPDTQWVPAVNVTPSYKTQAKLTTNATTNATTKPTANATTHAATEPDHSPGSGR